MRAYARDAVGDSYLGYFIIIIERVIIYNVICSVIIFGQGKLGIGSYIVNEIIYSVYGIELIIALSLYLTLSAVYLKSILSYAVTCSNIQR